MSPVLGAGGVGYDDYQRIQNYDSAILYSFTAPPSNSTLDSAVIPVLRWSYLEGILTPNTNASQLTFTWTSDAAGFDTIGVRKFNISPLITNPMQFRLSNLGPYVQIEQAPIAGLNWGCSGAMFGGNRQSLLEAIPQQPLVMNVQAATVGAVTQVFFYPTDYFAGPATLWYQSQFATGFIALQFLDATGTWDYVWQSATVGALLQNTALITLPLGAWRISSQNTTGAAGNFYLGLVHSTTGSV
jgi:hypothetical protein